MPALLLAAQALAALSGDYVCVYGCRLTDAPPSIVVEDRRAICFNEFGGKFEGEMRGPDTVACFRKTGRLDADGITLRWSDGVVWKRRPLVRK